MCKYVNGKMIVINACPAEFDRTGGNFDTDDSECF